MFFNHAVESEKVALQLEKRQKKERIWGLSWTRASHFLILGTQLHSRPEFSEILWYAHNQLLSLSFALFSLSWFLLQPKARLVNALYMKMICKSHIIDNY